MLLIEIVPVSVIRLDLLIGKFLSEGISFNNCVPLREVTVINLVLCTVEDTGKTETLLITLENGRGSSHEEDPANFLIFLVKSLTCAIRDSWLLPIVVTFFKLPATSFCKVLS